MRVDQDLFLAMEHALREGRATEATVPALRLYTWDVPTISLGKSQTPEVALAPRWEAWQADPGGDPAGPRAVVHRPTGGRAVWHEQELTYSVVFPLRHPLFQDGTVGPDEAFGRWLLEGATQAGIAELTLERGAVGRDPLGLGAAPCFASTSRNELKWHGRKWVGSARRLGQMALLQHGAIRLGPAGDRLEEWLTGRRPADDRPWSELPSPAQLAEHLVLALLRQLERV
jgi:lipoyl(octanoyl) transferase